MLFSLSFFWALCLVSSPILCWVVHFIYLLFILAFCIITEIHPVSMYRWQRSPILWTVISLDWFFFSSQKLSTFMKFYLLMDSLISWVNRALYRKSLPGTIYCCVVPILSSCSTKSTLRSLILVQGEREGLCFIRYPIFQGPFAEEAVFSPACLLSIIFKDGAVVTGTYVWTLFSAPLAYMSVTLSVPCCFDYYGSHTVFCLYQQHGIYCILLMDTRFQILYFLTG